MKRLLPIAVVVIVLAALVVAGTVSAAPLADPFTRLYPDSCTASSTYPGTGCEYLQDDSSSSLWGNNALLPAWVRFDMGTPVQVERVMLRGENGGYGRVQNFMIEASDTGAFAGEEVWLYSGVHTNDTVDRYYTFANTGSYQYYRIYISSSYILPWTGLSELWLFDDEAVVPTATPGGTVIVEVTYPTPVPQYFDPTANSGDGPEPWLLRFYVGVFVVFAFTYVVFRFVDTHQFYLLFMALCMAAAWVTRSVNGAAYVYLFMLVMILVLKLWSGLQRLVGVGQ